MNSFEYTFDDHLNRLRERLLKTVEATRDRIIRLDDGTVLKFEYPTDGKWAGTKEGLIRLVDSFHERLELAAMEAVEDGDANGHEPSIEEVRSVASESFATLAAVTDAIEHLHEEVL